MINLFNKFKDNNVLIIGDIMLDTYIYGKVDRVSPEAPVPVVDINETKYKLGGASNVALNIKSLGANPIICSIIGNDENGNILDKLLLNNNLTSKYICRTNRKTTNKIRVIGNNFQLLRLDDEIREDLNDYIYDKFKKNVKECIQNNKIDAIIFQDHDKGIISDKLINYVNEINLPLGIPIFVDPKNKNFKFYNKCKLFKPNLNELKRGVKDDYLNDNNLNNLYPHINNLMKDNNIEIFYTTLGDNGILLSFKENNDIIHKHINGIKRNVCDVSGAGDTVISVATLLTINNYNTIKSAIISNIAGGIVCEYVGVTPINKNELLEHIKEFFDQSNFNG